MGTSDMDTIAAFVLDALGAGSDERALASIRGRVNKFASAFAVPGVDNA